MTGKPMLWKTKSKAFAIHLMFSVVVVLAFLWAVSALWYPDGLFVLEDVWEALRILVPVDAILGPILTFYLWNPAKKGVKFDIVVISLLQIAALVYGGHLIYQQRPAVYVFAGDRFEIVPASKFDASRLPAGMFAEPLDEPLIAYAMPAQTAQEQDAFVWGNVQYQKMPERYRPMAPHAMTWQAKALQWEYIQPQGNDIARWEAFRQQHAPTDVFLFPLEGTAGESMIVAIDASGARVAHLDLDPWTVYHEPAATTP